MEKRAAGRANCSPFIYCLTILGVFMTPPSGFIVVPFSAYFTALFMQLLYASFQRGDLLYSTSVLLYINKYCSVLVFPDY